MFSRSACFLPQEIRMTMLYTLYLIFYNLFHRIKKKKYVTKLNPRSLFCALWLFFFFS